MAQRQNNWARQARKHLQDAKAEYQRARAERPRGSRAEVEAMIKRSAAAFDLLEVGDSLAAFGLSAVVAKKNRKSVITTSGSRWTRYELTGVA